MTLSLRIPYNTYQNLQRAQRFAIKQSTSHMGTDTVIPNDTTDVDALRYVSIYKCIGFVKLINLITCYKMYSNSIYVLLA